MILSKIKLCLDKHGSLCQLEWTLLAFGSHSVSAEYLQCSASLHFSLQYILSFKSLKR